MAHSTNHINEVAVRIQRLPVTDSGHGLLVAPQVDVLAALVASLREVPRG